ncbi:MAG: FtsX-like permease family protein, partial [Bacteroidota bacterium]
KRVLEVGIKKVLGAKPRQLFFQFLSESFFITALGSVLALLLVLIALPFVNDLVGSNLSQNLYTLPHFLVVLGLYLSMSFLAGIYPSSVLANYSTTKVLKEKAAYGTSNFGINKSLIVLQFSISIILMISSFMVHRQLQFMQNAKLGFDPVQTLVIDFDGDQNVQEKKAIIQQELLNIPGVNQITASSGVPGRDKPGGWSMRFLSPTGDTLRTEVPLYIVDHNFLPQYNIEMLAGRAFSKDYLADSEETILISEATVKSLGFNDPNQVLGMKVLMYPKTAEVVGVFQDFHYESLQSAIQPLAMRIFPFGTNVFSLQLETVNLQATIAAIEQKWKTLAPQRPLSYTFLDEDYNQQYATETQFGQTLGLFTIFALLIANLGLFGLTLFSVQQRTKEIGTRKVLGASVLDIVQLLAQHFLKLVLFATLLATPIAWYFMNNWLQSFAYRMDVQWWIFVVAGAAAILIALLTVSVQTVKAALANPVESLRSE